MRNNDAQHIVRLARPEPERTVLSAVHIARVSEQNETHEAFSSFAFSRGIIGKFVTVLLLPMIFIYPLAPAYAADESTAASSTPEQVPAEIAETPPVTDSLSSDLGSALSGAAAAVADLFVGGETSSTSEEMATTTPDTLPATDDTATTSEGMTLLDDTASSTDSGSLATSTPSDSDASTTPAIPSGSSSSDEFASSTSSASSTDDILDTASSTEESVTPSKSAQEIAAEMLREKEDSMRASIRKEVEDEFTKGCVSLDTTGYYCLKDRPNSGESLTPSNVITDVTSRPDASGQWKQIFITRGGIEEQLTHFSWDNAFPATDVSGKSVVWQGNVNGRWQIFYATISASGTPSIMEVTHSNESNFNPKVDGDDIVWQGWVDGNWEIFLAEHLTPENYLASTTLPIENKLLAIDNSWKVTRVTTNSGHDMFPSVAGGLTTWQSFQDNAWNVYVYSMKTGTTQKISKSGEKSEQPRFAITWDERTTEGNTRMVGYDIASGKTIDLTEEARRVNDDKPYTPTAPITQPDQAALPISGSGTSTSAKSEGDANGTSTPNGLDI
jgi:hypothetical protein